MDPCLLTCIPFPTINTPTPSRMVHAVTLTGHHPEFTGDIGVTLGVARSVGFDKYIMTCMYPSGAIQSVFTALRILCVPPVCSLLLPPAL